MADPKTVLITGAAGGVGRAAVDVFLEAGWRVLAVDVQKQGSLPEGALAFQADIADPENIKKLADEASQHLPDGLDALVNNAAVQIAKALVDTSAEEWDAIHAVNLRAPFLLAKYFHKLLVQAKGAVVNVASVHALATSPEIGAYASTKGGLLALTRSLAIELGPLGVRVNSVLPGATDTGMLQAGLGRGGKDPAAQRKLLEEKILLRRIAEPSEIARAIYFLADSTQSSYVTGQSLVADGGVLARLSSE